MLKKEKKIYVAGHLGMVGSAIMRKLTEKGFHNLVTRDKKELDLLNQDQVKDFMNSVRPDVVVLAAAKVGGIYANNTYPAEFVYQNLMIESNVIHQAYHAGVPSLLFLGSSCIYPKQAAQPMREESLLTGLLEPTNEPYAIAKIAGIKLCESYNRQYGVDFRSVMPTNLYGPNDNFHPENSHVVPSLIRKFYEANKANSKIVDVWGTGKVMREFLHVDDMASACIHILNLERKVYADSTTAMCSHVNVGAGKDITIEKLARLLKKVSGFQGEIAFDASKPDGAPRKLLDCKRLASLGWQPSISLEEGLHQAYTWFSEHGDNYLK